jgi:hypothetical protein
VCEKLGLSSGGGRVGVRVRKNSEGKTSNKKMCR